ncbi:glycerol-3-phosphate 1-O-acyltransferase PlsB [Alteromonas sp. a30]|uniref:glycerol-3-phosphate 1-O-acyltransferase PlsB n=1 Tax=Alteromonas sp. a30 TaxID=2730917 RepID=UPI002280D73D|nr:glycerol-3-phosphate 1-O-acyltransferase PlsB [Alteromonas sp. a30]MCY7295742.1 glycerol-3-phosphate 1-O-acyltransferase PlsB [Alteromonas sp. a30]
MLDFRKLFLQIIKHPTRFLLKANHTPADLEGELGISKDKPIIYLLKSDSATDLIALELVTKKLGLPNPFKAINLAGTKTPATLFVDKPRSFFSNGRKLSDLARNSAEMFKLHRLDENLDIQIVPVSIFWGRDPEKQSKGWSDLLTMRNSPGWLRKFFIVLFLGRDNVVGFSRAVSSRNMVSTMSKESDERLAHKLVRLARTHFVRKQQAMTGPRLLHRTELFNGVLGADAVKAAIQEEAEKVPLQEAKARAQKYIEEIAADYNSTLIRLLDRVLTKVWNKIYNGINVHHADKVRELARNGHEIVYVPCHRSHMDYLLLTYVIYHEGLMTPYIAAGINLNFWPIGGIFRRGGAFFIRRTFGGNKLYTAVFREYLEQLFKRGYSVKYYAEGGRSRTGRLLPPKTGMLAMTVQALLKGVNRPISIVPVYIGYEHVMEVSTYLKELKGTKKQKESFTQIFSAIRNLKNYGHGFLNFGDPINLSQYLDDVTPNWREGRELVQDGAKPNWLTPTVNRLGVDILQRINSAAAVNGMTLAALCLLCAKKHTLSREELVFSMQTFIDMQRKSPFSHSTTLPEQDADALLEDTIKLGKFSIHEDKFGQVFSLDRRIAITLTYYRNNILHMFAIPSLIAAVVIGKRGCTREKLTGLISRLYPLLKRELFLYMSDEKAAEYTSNLIDTMLDIGLLAEHDGQLVEPQPPRSNESKGDPKYTLWLLNRVVQETLQRYTLVLSQLEDVERISRPTLEEQSQRVAERMSMLHGINAPEFYDKNVLNTFIAAMRDNNLLSEDSNGLLVPDAETKALKEELLTLVSPGYAQRVQQVKYLPLKGINTK